jgi:hypothetical protein
MKLETAPTVESEEDVTCAVCDTENPFVLYDGEKVCTECGHTPTSGGRSVTHETDQWSSWLQHRRDEYDGFYGDERIKFVGGFEAAYY